jgi:hypothetical protein
MGRVSLVPPLHADAGGDGMMRRYMVHLANGEAQFVHGHSPAQAMSAAWDRYRWYVFPSPPLWAEVWE